MADNDLRRELELLAERVAVLESAVLTDDGEPPADPAAEQDGQPA